jgi:hypothetical protein
VAGALKLTAHFLENRLFAPHGGTLPGARRQLPDMLKDGEDG